MKITSIETQKKNKNRCSIFIDYEFAFGMLIHDCGMLKLKEGKELTQTDYDYIIKYIVLEDAKNTANRYLSFKPRTQKEVVEKLKQKEFSEEIIDTVIELLISYRYIDDIKYTDDFISDSINLKNRGHIRIKQELRQRGISGDIIENAFLELDTKDEEIDKAYHLICDKIKSNNPDFKEKNRINNLLMRRGFSYDDIKSAFHRFDENIKYEFEESSNYEDSFDED